MARPEIAVPAHNSTTLVLAAILRFDTQYRADHCREEDRDNPHRTSDGSLES
jgi:hypothetical protein